MPRDNAGVGPGLEHLEIQVAGVRRDYWLARGPQPPGPLLIMLHGSGTTGRDAATTFTGLAGWAAVPAGQDRRPHPRHLDATGILLEQMTANEDFPPPGVSRDTLPPPR